MFHILHQKNRNVTKHYLSIIEHSVKMAGYEVGYVDNLNLALTKMKTDYYVVSTNIEAFVLLLSGRKNIIMWIQGLTPEESYMRHNSILRKKVLEGIDKFVNLKCKLLIFVSESMKDYISEKYDQEYNNYFIMPCFNESIAKDSFFTENKYFNNVFVYAGGLSKWQCIEKTLDLYKTIEDQGLPNIKLLFLTQDRDKALAMINSRRIKKYSIDYVDKDMLQRVLAEVKYGFVLRDENPVNRVSTPTKISTYIAHGIIPIYSNCIDSFSKIASHMKYVINYDDVCKEQNKIFEKFACCDPNDIYREYKEIFSFYYNESMYLNNLVTMIEKLGAREKQNA